VQASIVTADSPVPAWLAAYELAVALFEKGDFGPAVDLLRSLALAEPHEERIWQALAQCHDAADDPEVAKALRTLGRLLGDVEKPRLS
jgi:Flp pilus assembly protein TadD